MTINPIPPISNPFTTTSTLYGGDVMINIGNLLNDTDISPLFDGWRPIIKTQFLFRSDKFAMYDSDSSNEVHLIVDDITNHLGNVNLHIPAFTDDDQTMVLTTLPQILENKVLSTGTTFSADVDFAGNSILDAVIDGDLNTLQDIDQASLKQITDKAKLPNSTVYTDQANSYGNFLQTFPRGYLRINDGDTHHVALYTSNQTGNFNVEIPLVTSNDFFAMRGTANVFTTTQKIQDGGSPLILYRPTASQWTGEYLHFNLQNDNLTEVSYAQIGAFIADPLAGSHDGYLLFQVSNNGVMKEHAIIVDHKLGITNTGGSRANLDPSGLTGHRDFTFPNLNGKIATDTNANVFSAIQTINAGDWGYPLVLERPNKVFAVAIDFKLHNSLDQMVRYGVINFGVEDNTAGAHSGDFKVQNMRAGALATTMEVDSLGDITIGRNQRLKFSESGLTALRTLTAPNESGQLVIGTDTRLSDQRTPLDNSVTSAKIADGTIMDVDVNANALIQSTKLRHVLPSPVKKISGRWDGIKGSGLFDEMIMYGDNISYVLSGTHLQTTRFLTNAVANRRAGMRKGFLLCRPITNPSFKIVKRSGAGNTNTRHYYGFTSYVTEIPSGTTPLGINDSGAIIGFRETDTNYQIWTNDGLGGAAFITNTGVPVTSGDKYIELKFTSNGTNLQWSIWDSSENLLASGNITTQLPSTTTSLSLCFQVESTSTQASNLYLNAGEILT